MIEIIIADDHSIVRKGLKDILEEERDFLVTGEAESGEKLLSILEEKTFDVVILDVTMPGQGGLETLKDIIIKFPALPVLMLSVHKEDQYAFGVLKAGAAGYINKKSNPEELMKAIRMVAAGKKYVSEYLADLLASNLNIGNKTHLHDTLSDREFQVMQLIAEGKTPREIAEILSLSVNSINTYRSRVLEKIHIKSNAEIAAYVIQNGLMG
ncbi:MAG: response regulator transcription factor [Chlorobi bacterium]|nr:response regulator transcription factor [Chlorobiota bacterium]